MSEPLPDQLGTTVQQLVRLLAREVARELTRPQPTDGRAEDRSPWLSVESAARYLDWPKQRLYKLSAQGAIPHYKQQGRLLFHRGELDQWLRSFAQGERPN